MSDIDTLAELQLRRKDFIKMVNSNTNRACAKVRRALGWDPNAEEKDREKINGKASSIVAKAFAGKGCDIPGLEVDLEVIRQSLEPLHAMRHGIELEMKRIAKRLPVYPWAKQVRGLGELGLAVIVGETGDLGNYSNPGKVWKRLGLAPFEKDGISMAASNWRRKGGLSAEDWTVLGYSPGRRAEIYAVIGDPLFRAQSVVVGPYRQRYDQRRARTAETHPDWTKGHSHGDAVRVMTKELLRDLWVAWREATAGVYPMQPLPLDHIAEAA